MSDIIGKFYELDPEGEARPLHADEIADLLQQLPIRILEDPFELQGLPTSLAEAAVAVWTVPPFEITKEIVVVTIINGIHIPLTQYETWGMNTLFGNIGKSFRIDDGMYHLKSLVRKVEQLGIQDPFHIKDGSITYLGTDRDISAQFQGLFDPKASQDMKARRRHVYALRRNGFFTIDDLLALGDIEKLDGRNIGKVTRGVAREAIENFNKRNQ